jgi:predicted site-specific integrase-resolvase
MSGTFPIGEVARQTGIKVPTIRFYEQIGLLPAPPRSEGNRRCYRESDVGRLGPVYIHSHATDSQVRQVLIQG